MPTINAIGLQKQDGTLHIDGTGAMPLFQDAAEVTYYLFCATKPLGFGERGEVGPQFTTAYAAQLVQVPVTLTY